MGTLLSNLVLGPARAIALKAAVIVWLIPIVCIAGRPDPASCPMPQDTETRLLNLAFGKELYNGPLIYPAVASIDDVAALIDDLFMPVEFYPHAYDELVNLNHSHECLGDLGCAINVFSTSYEIRNRRATAYAYFKPAENRASRNAALIIPGSGINQSSGIYFSDPDNYHFDIAGLVSRHWDAYVYVKPNEDFLAIHNGKKKLNQEYIIRPHLNSGGSYSCRYLIDTMAIVKHLKSNYDKTVVIGLSQGGEATLYNSLQSQPDGAIVSSGFSVITERLYDGGIGQIIIPDMREYHGSSSIYETISQSATQYLFTWGLKEESVYGADAELGCTAAFFSDLPNVTCAIHGGGHRFPEPEIADFLWSVSEQTPDIAIVPSSLDFGESYVGFVNTKDLVIINQGTGILSVVNISCNDDEFTANATSFDLIQGDSMVVTVECSPVAEGDRSAYLTIVSNDPDEAEVLVALTAHAIEPPLVITSPESLAVLFHPVVPRERVLTLSNSGGSDLVFSAGPATPNADWLSIYPTEGIIAPGESLKVTVFFEGEGLDDGTYSQALVIDSNDPYNPSLAVSTEMLVKTVALPFTRLVPKTLALGGGGGWVTAFVELPEECDPSDVIQESVLLEYAVPAVPGKTLTWIEKGNGPADLAFRFDRVAVEQALTTGSHVPVLIAGEIAGKAWFVGIDSITVINNQTASATLKSEQPKIQGPTDFALYQSVPNPASGRVAIGFDIPRSCHVRLRLYDTAGRLVKTLADKEMAPGHHSASWDTRNSQGDRVPRGVYAYEIIAGEFRAAKKLVVSN